MVIRTLQLALSLLQRTGVRSSVFLEVSRRQQDACFYGLEVLISGNGDHGRYEPDEHGQDVDLDGSLHGQGWAILVWLYPEIISVCGYLKETALHHDSQKVTQGYLAVGSGAMSGGERATTAATVLKARGQMGLRRKQRNQMANGCFTT